MNPSDTTQDEIDRFRRYLSIGYLEQHPGDLDLIKSAPKIWNAVQAVYDGVKGTTADVEIMAEVIRQFDWEPFLRVVQEREATAMQNSSDRYQSFLNEEVPCGSCGVIVLRRDLYPVDMLPNRVLPYGRDLCQLCGTTLIESLTVQCALCGIKYIKKINVVYDFCPQCNTAEHRYENQRVRAQNNRAMYAGLPATLTIAEWLATLTYFKGRCAYCGTAAYDEIEHFVPISLGSGTTRNNCVPSCNACNYQKGKWHPDSSNVRIPRIDIDRVRAYLATR